MTVVQYWGIVHHMPDQHCFGIERSFRWYGRESTKVFKEHVIHLVSHDTKSFHELACYVLFILAKRMRHEATLNLPRSDVAGLLVTMSLRNEVYTMVFLLEDPARITEIFTAHIAVAPIITLLFTSVAFYDR